MDSVGHIIKDSSWGVFRDIQTATEMDKRKTIVWHKGARRVSIEVVDRCYGEILETEKISKS